MSRNEDFAGGAKRTRYFHRSDVDFQPGQHLLPAAERGHESKWGYLDSYSPNHVYVYEGKKTGPREEQHAYAKLFGPALGRHVYEVEPLGDLQTDPEVNRRSGRARHRGKAMMAPRARVVRRVVDGGPGGPPPCRQCAIPPGLRGAGFKPHPH